MNTRSLSKSKTKARHPEAKLFVVAACIFFGISCLGCTHENNEEAPKSAPPSPVVPQTGKNASQEAPMSPEEEKTPTEITKYPAPAETSTAAGQNATKSGERGSEQKSAPKESSPPSQTSVVAKQGAVGSGKKTEEQKTISPGVSKNAMPTETAAVQHAKKETSPPPTPSQRTGTVDATRLNVRQQPDLTATKLAVIPRGTEVKIIAEKDEWYHITAKNGSLKGWVAKRYIQVTPTETSSSGNASVNIQPLQAS